MPSHGLEELRAVNQRECKLSVQKPALPGGAQAHRRTHFLMKC